MLCHLPEVEKRALAAVGAVEGIPAGDTRLAVDAGPAGLGGLAGVLAGGFFGAGFAGLEIPGGKIDETVAGMAAVLAHIDGGRFVAFRL